MKKLFTAILDNSLTTSIVLVAIPALFTVLANMQAEQRDDLSLASYNGGVAVALAVLSIFLTLLPQTWLRVYTVNLLTKLTPRATVVWGIVWFFIEAGVVTFSSVGYAGALAGSTMGGLGVVVLSIINVGFLVFWGVAALVLFLIQRSRKNTAPTPAAAAYVQNHYPANTPYQTGNPYSGMPQLPPQE